MDQTVAQPHESEIDFGPTQHPTDALSIHSPEGALHEAYSQAQDYRRVAQATLDALHHAVAERDVLRDDNRRLRAENPQLRAQLRHPEAA